MSSIRPGVAWPPPQLATVTARVDECRVWWEGDPDKLDKYYGGTGRTSPSGQQNKGLRAAWDAFWGKAGTTANGETAPRMHAPIARDISKLSAVSLFAKPPRILRAGDEPESIQALIDDKFNTPRFHSNLYTAGETSSALSGVFGRVVWDEDIQDGTWIEWVDPDHAIAEWHRGRLKAVTFFTELDTDDPRTIWRHMERYEKGRIVHELYKGTATNLGVRMSLNDHEATQDIPVELGDDGYSYVDLGIDELAVDYVPNELPNPEWAKDPQLRNLGSSDISVDLIPIYHKIDRVYSSLMWDVDAGRAKVVVSRDLLQNAGPGAGLHLPAEQGLFTQVGTAIGKEGSAESLFQYFQPAIRVLEHDQVGEMLLREVLRRTGYSPVSFGMSDEVAQTATEATGKKEWTVLTTEGKARYFGAALQHLTTTALRIDAVKFPGMGADLSEPLDLDWPPFAKESDLSRAQTVQAWSTAGAASTRTMVRYLHQDWDEDQVDEEVDEIEKGSAVEAPIFGSDAPPFGGQPAGDEQPEEEQDVEEASGDE